MRAKVARCREQSTTKCLASFQKSRTAAKLEAVIQQALMKKRRFIGLAKRYSIGRLSVLFYLSI